MKKKYIGYNQDGMTITHNWICDGKAVKKRIDCKNKSELTIEKLKGYRKEIKNEK